MRQTFRIFFLEENKRVFGRKWVNKQTRIEALKSLSQQIEVAVPPKYLHYFFAQAFRDFQLEVPVATRWYEHVL